MCTRRLDPHDRPQHYAIHDTQVDPSDTINNGFPSLSTMSQTFLFPLTNSWFLTQPEPTDLEESILVSSCKTPAPCSSCPRQCTPSAP